MQKHSYYLCKYLAQNKVNVDLVHFNSSSYDILKLEFFSEEEKKYITSIIVDFPKGSGLPGHYIRKSYLHSKLIFKALKDKIQYYDFIYTKGFTGWYLIEQKKAGKIKCCKVGVKFHGYEMFQRSPDLKTKLQHIFLLRKPVKYISQNADAVFSYGGKITEIIKSLGVPGNKIIGIPSGVEEAIISENITPTSGKIKFLFLGRYERRKGIEELNQSLLEIKNPNFEFHFIGPIPQDKKIQAGNIIYNGEIRDKSQLNSMIKNCDVLVCPSWSEGMPNVILEAMANGLSVIATNVGANNILVNENTGWLIENSEPAEILSALNKVLNEKYSGIDQKKQNSLHLIKTGFTWEKLILNFLSKIKSL